MGTGQEIVIQLTLKGKPTAFSVVHDDGSFLPEPVANGINAVRLFGHSQLFVTYDRDSNTVVRAVEKVRKIVQAMQVEGEKIEVTTTPSIPSTPEGRRLNFHFCRVDLRLKK